MKRIWILILVLSATALLYSQAAVTWPLTSNGTPTASGSATGANLVKGSGVGTLDYGSNGVFCTGWKSQSRNLNDYYQYTVTASAAIVINQVSLYSMYEGNKASSAAVYYSINGATEQLLGNFSPASGSPAQTSFTGLSYAVSSGQTFCIRVYAWGQQNNTRFWNRNVKIISSATTLGSSNPAIAAASIVPGTAKVPVYRFTLQPNSSVDFTGLRFTTTGSCTATDINNFKLWANSSDNLSTATQVGTAKTDSLSAGSRSFAPFNSTLSADAVNYFWITADFGLAAVAGNTLGVSAVTTAALLVSEGMLSGTAYAGGVQTIASATVLSSADPAVPAANIVRGTVRNSIYRFTLGSSTGTILTGLTFRTRANVPAFTQADLVRFQLFSSDTDDLGTATQIGNDLTTLAAQGSDNTFSSVSQILSTGVLRYFWITVDLSATATTGHIIAIENLTTDRFTVSSGIKAGTAYSGGQQTVATSTTTLASNNPAVPAANIGRGTLKNPIYRFTLAANGPTTLTQITFVATGTNLAANIDRYQLWTSTVDTFASAMQLGSNITTIPASRRTVSFSSLNQALAANITRYFWISADLDANATVGNTITVSAMGTGNFTVSGNKAGTAYAGGAQSIVGPAVALSSSNPAVQAGIVNNGTVKNPIYRFLLTRDAATGTATLTGLSFSTTGTATATDIAKFQLWTGTSDDLGSAVKIGADITTSLGQGSHSFGTLSQSLAVGSIRYFWITADLTSSAVGGRTLSVSALPYGNLTVSGASVSGSGIAGGTQTIGSLVTTLASNSPAVSVSPLAQGQAKRALHRFTLSCNGNVSLNSVSFVSAGDYASVDISKFQLWTGILDDLNAAGQLGTDITSSLGSGSHSFSSLSLPLASGATQYFWITTDAAVSATPDKNIGISAITTSNISVSAGSVVGGTSSGGDQTFCTAQQWMYAKGQVIGQTANAGTGYQIRVKVYRSAGTDSGENIYVESNCREDFGDIRFFEGDNALDYWMENATYGSNATFWVELNGDLSTSNLYLTMKCSNPSVTTTSNGLDTFLFFDDFNRTNNSLTQWTKHKTLDGSTISIPKGDNFVRNDGGNSTGTYGHSVLGSYPTYTNFSNGVVEYRFRLSAEAISEVGFRGSFGNPGTGYKGRSDSRTTGTNGGHSFLEPPYYGWQHLSDTPENNTDKPTTNTWLRGSVSAYNSSLKIYRDGIEKRASTLGVISGPGEISLQNHYGQYTDYDWVAVRKYANADPARGTWFLAPVAVAATAICHNGFTARWNTVNNATGYQLDVLTADGSAYIPGWQNIPVSYNVKRVELVDIGTDFQYRIRAVYSGGISPNSNIIYVSSTQVINGISATTSILGAPMLTYVPPVVTDPAFTNNDVRIDPEGSSTDDFNIELSYHPSGYDIWPAGRLLAKISCSNNSALNGTFTLKHVGMGFIPASAVLKWGGNWTTINPVFSADSTVVTVSGIAKEAKGAVEILLDDSSGTLPVELSSFMVQVGTGNLVVVQWVTQSETNVSGFLIYRGLSTDFSMAKSLNIFIPATNSSQMQVYQYTDEEELAAGAYYYWLESMDMDGSSNLFGPVSIEIGENHGNIPEIPIVEGFNNIYPNPFTGTARINYGVKRATLVELEIYNLKGQLVRRLVSESKDRGNHQTSWDGKDDQGSKVSSGVYLARIKGTGGSKVKKLVLSK